jgi:hypothetical protein
MVAIAPVPTAEGTTADHARATAIMDRALAATVRADRRGTLPASRPVVGTAPVAAQRTAAAVVGTPAGADTAAVGIAKAR